MINFDELTHTYTDSTGTKYISVTTLLKKYNLSADYANIPKDVLAKAAIRGNATHKELENYIKTRQASSSLDVQNFIKYITARGIDLTTAKSEEMVYDSNYLIAGTIDFQYKEGDIEIIADFKTTSSIHWDSVAWQLSIYNFILSQGNIFLYYMKQLKVYHLYNGRLTVRDIPIIDYDEVVNLLTANLNNAPYAYTPDTTRIISDSECTIMCTLLDEIRQCETLLQELERKKEIMQEKLMKNMKTNSMHKCDTGTLLITYTDSNPRRSVDTNILKEYCAKNNIDINNFYKTTMSKPSLKILKKGNKQ